MKRYRAAVILLLFFGILGVKSLGPHVSFDAYWHLKMGQDFLFSNLSPFIDHYSYKLLGSPINSPPIIFQVLLASLASVFGVHWSFVILKLLYSFVLIFVSYNLLKRLNSNFSILTISLLLITYFASLRLIIRPELLSNILTILLLFIMFRLKEKIKTSYLIALPLLLIFWTNYHTAVIGYVIVFAFFAEKLIMQIVYENESFSEVLKLLSFGTLIFFIGFLNPEFDHPVIEAIFFNNEWTQFFGEFRSSIEVYKDNVIIVSFWLIVLFFSFFAIWRQDYGLAFILLFLGYYGVQHIRMLPIVNILSVFIIVYQVSKLPRHLLRNISSNVKNVFSITVFLVLLLESGFIETSSKKILALTEYKEQISQINEQRLPLKATHFLNYINQGGKIYNTFNSGGFLLYKLNSNFKINIDGRTNILYPIEHYQEYLKSLDDIKVLDQHISLNNVDFAIFKSTSRALNHFKNSKKMSLFYSDLNYAIFSKNENKGFKIASLLIKYPYCYNPALDLAISSEIKRAEELKINDNFLFKQVLNIFNSEVNQVITAETSERWKLHLNKVNFYKLFNSARWDDALRQLDRIALKSNIDLVYASIAAFETGNYKLAEQLLFRSLLNEQSPYEKIDNNTLLYLLSKLQNRIELSLISQSQISQIKKQTASENSLDLNASFELTHSNCGLFK